MEAFKDIKIRVSIHSLRGWKNKINYYWEIEESWVLGLCDACSSSSYPKKIYAKRGFETFAKLNGIKNYEFVKEA